MGFGVGFGNDERGMPFQYLNLKGVMGFGNDERGMHNQHFNLKVLGFGWGKGDTRPY